MKRLLLVLTLELVMFSTFATTIVLSCDGESETMISGKSSYRESFRPDITIDDQTGKFTIVGLSLLSVNLVEAQQNLTIPLNFEISDEKYSFIHKTNLNEIVFSSIIDINRYSGMIRESQLVWNSDKKTLLSTTKGVYKCVKLTKPKF